MLDAAVVVALEALLSMSWPRNIQNSLMVEFQKQNHGCSPMLSKVDIQSGSFALSAPLFDSCEIDTDLFVPASEGLIASLGTEYLC